MALRLGMTIDNRYEVLREVGRGGMSIVYLVYDQKLKTERAAKEIIKHDGKRGEIHERSLLAEAELLKRLDHPYLPRIIDVLDVGSSKIIIMDFIQGLTLKEVLLRVNSVDQDLVVQWGIQMSEGLGYLHTRETPIIYRDMKPGNVMLQPMGSIKIFDFGTSRGVDRGEAGLTQALGTAGYAAPEQMARRKDGGATFDERTDVYSLGMTLYHLVTGHSPIESPDKVKPITYWDNTLSGGLEKIISKATMLDPDDRYQSMEDFRNDLLRYKELEQPFIKKQKNKVYIFGVVLLLGLVLGLGSLSFGFMVRNETSNLYDTYVNEGLLSSDVNKYYDALSLDGSDPEVYKSIIELVKVDGVFDLEDEQHLISALNTNLDTLKRDSNYSDLAYEVGKLYWFYYDNSMDGRVKSVLWFKDASLDDNFERRGLAESYVVMGDFYSSIVISIEEAEDGGRYANYWENLGLLYDSEDPQGELMTLELVSLTYDFIDSYGVSLRSDGVKLTDVNSLLDRADGLLGDSLGTSQKTLDMRTSLMKQKDSVRTSVDRIYTDRGVK